MTKSPAITRTEQHAPESPQAHPDEPTFATGDLVRLKSGSPRMVVSELWTDGTVTVTFYAAPSFVHAKFYSEVLELA